MWKKNKYSLLKILIFGFITLLIAFSIGYYFGSDNSRRATVIQSTKDGIATDISDKIFDHSTKNCIFTIYPGNNNEPKALLFDRLKLVDIDSYKVVGNKLFYSTGPVYGKPEIGVIDCVSSVKKTIIPAENTQGNYPYGSDYFRIKKIFKELTGDVYNIQYYYGSDVDKIDFNKFESESNLKIFKYSEKQ